MPLQGERTYGTQADGWLTSYKVVDEESLVSVPDYLSWEQAATLPCAAVTAWNSLQQSRSVLPGETVLTEGHRWSLTVCGAVRQNHGARVIALTSNDVKAQLLSALGADHVINYRHYPEWSVKSGN